MENPTVNPLGLTVEEVARLLGLSEEKVRQHLANGLPVMAGGRINLVQYAAWLNREMVENDGD
jgi:predicted transcriptional regulator